MLPAILTTFLWSCSSICAARSARLVGGAAANLTRMALAAALLAIWAHTWGRAGLGGAAFPWFLLSGVIGFGVGDIAMFGALERVGPRLTMLLTHCLAAPLAAFVEWMWMGTRLGWGEIGCAALILTGVALALAPDHGSGIPRRTFWIGVLCGLGSACGQGFGSVISIRANRAAVLAHQSVDGATAAYERILAGLVVAFLFFIFLRKRENKPAPGVWSRAWVWITANALAGPSIGVAVFQWGLATTPAGIIMPIVATAPVLTQFLAWAVDGTPPTHRTAIGGAIAVAGVIALRFSLGQT
jgi:drug/metabolite transporter (DMT)-like permease